MEARTIERRKGFEEAREKFEETVSRLRSEGTSRMTVTEVEEVVESAGREIMRRLVQSHLDLRSEREERLGEVVGADGGTRTHCRSLERGLTSAFGPVAVKRLAYSGRAMTSLMPLDAELNLPRELYSLGLQRRVVEEVARGSFDATALAVERTTGVSVAKRQVEETAVRAAEDFDIFYVVGGGGVGREPPEPGDVLVLTTDGKGIVMTQAGLREATRKAARKATTRLCHRLSKGEKRHRCRMATVASVYSVAPHPRTPEDIVRDLRPVRDVGRPRPPKPAHKRVWASVEKDTEAVVVEMFEEALRRDPERKLRWVAVVDGNETQLRLLREHAARNGVELTIVLDLIHVIEYLWRATTAVHGEGKAETERLVTERLWKVLHGKGQDVAAGMKQSAAKRGLRGRQRKAVEKAANYLLNHLDLMNYDAYLADGLPIASGVIEGACRYLVADRMGITGARWGLDTAEAVLRLRALKASGDFDLYWRFHERQLSDRVHAARYAHRAPPSTTPPARPFLTLVREAA